MGFFEKTGSIVLNGQAKTLVFDLDAPQGDHIKIFGFDKNFPANGYIFGEFNINGLTPITIPLPLAPNILSYRVLKTHPDTDMLAVNVIDGVSPMPFEYWSFPGDKELLLLYVRFLTEFAQKCSYLPYGIYPEKDEAPFFINLNDYIVGEDGKPIKTSAMTFVDSGNILVSKEYFDRMTVPMRVFTLFHEAAHFFLGLSSADYNAEQYCDEFALRLMLYLDFPAYEALMHHIHILKNNPQNQARTANLRQKIGLIEAEIDNYRVMA